MTIPLKASDFFDRMRHDNPSFHVESFSGTSETLLSRGSCVMRPLRHGLVVRHSDNFSLCDLATESETPPQLSIKLFLEGGVSASIGGHNIPMPRCNDAGEWEPTALIVWQKGREAFRRRVAAGDRVRKFIISIGPEWMDSAGFGKADALPSLKVLTDKPLSLRSFRPSAALLTLAEQIMRPPPLAAWLQQLYIESRTLGAIAEAFRAIGEEGACLAPVGLTPREHQHLVRAESALRAARGFLPSIELLADAAGVSPSALQRLFQAAHGVTVSQFMRTCKLAEARMALENEGMSVAQAAYIAGYASPANFATAFKREFGLSPKETRRR